MSHQHAAGCSLDERGFLTLRITNRGTGPIPADAGTLQSIVDGFDQGRFSLAELGVEAPRAPGHTAVIHTRLLLTGFGRRVAVLVDPDDMVEEENEFQNLLTCTLDAEHVQAPQVIIDDIASNEDGILFFTLANIGTADSEPDLRLRARVIMYDTFVTNDVIVRSRALRANTADRAVVFPVPPVTITPIYNYFRVRVRPADDEVRIDHTRADQRRRVPYEPPEEYRDLLTNPTLQQALTWQDASGVKSYTQWPASMQAALAEMLAALDRNPAAGTRSARVATDVGRLEPSEARRIYLSYVAHSLWLDASGHVDWPLTSYGVDALRCLLDSRWLLSYDQTTDRYVLDGGRLRAHLSRDPRVPYEFLVAVIPALCLIQTAPRVYGQPAMEATLYELTNWMRAHIVRAESDSGAVDGSPEPASPVQALDDILFRRTTQPITISGAADMRTLYVGIARALNIAIDGTSQEPGRLQFYRGNVHMYRADFMLDPVFAPSGDAVSVSFAFVTPAELNDLFVAPQVDCLDAQRTRCNSIEQQRAYNARARVIISMRDTLPDFVLRLRCNGTQEQFHAFLTGDGVHPLRSPGDIEAFRAAVEERVLDEGAGEWTSGCRRVEERWERFLAGR